MIEIVLAIKNGHPKMPVFILRQLQAIRDRRQLERVLQTERNG